MAKAEPQTYVSQQLLLENFTIPPHHHRPDSLQLREISSPDAVVKVPALCPRIQTHQPYAEGKERAEMTQNYTLISQGQGRSAE